MKLDDLKIQSGEMNQKLFSKPWRMSNLYRIVNARGMRVPFRPNRAQAHFDQHKAARNIILKSRRLGFTTFEAIDSVDDVLFTKNFSALMLSYDVPSQLEIFDTKVDFAWKNLPEWLRNLYKVDTHRSNELKFDFGDESYSSIQVRTRGRGGGYRRLHISEFGVISKESPRKAREIISGTVQAIPLDGRVDIESTAEEDVGPFHDMFWTAWERGDPETPVDYKAHFYNWQWDDDEMAIITEVLKDFPPEFREYQAKHNEIAAKDPARFQPITDRQLTYYYYKWLSLASDWKLLKKNYPTTPEEAFVSAGMKLFDPEIIGRMPSETGKKEGDWILYGNYVPGHRYALGADVAEGVGQDLSAATLIDFDWQERVTLADGTPITIKVPKVIAEYASNTADPGIFAVELERMGTRFGSCLIGVERNGPGVAVLMKLRDTYNNVYTEYTIGKTEDEPTERLGWHSNRNSKPKMLSDLNDAIREANLLITSKPIKRELRTYDKGNMTKVTFDPDQPSHWDRVMATGIAYQMAPHSIASQKKGNNQQEGSGEDTLDRFNSVPRV